MARDLGLKPTGDPLAEIVKFARLRIRSFLKEIPCGTLSDLLMLAAAKVNTLFVEIHTDQDLQAVKEQYIREGELAFADLEGQLGPDVFAITFKRQAARPSDRHFISVIDCRGGKGARCYFSKWHEIAHLLTLTSQQRLKFCRSHAPAETKDPEETVMDVIAGELGFFDEIVRRYAKSAPSFDAIAKLRECLCPEASMQASLIGFVHAWPDPCILIEAEWALKKREAEMENQGTFGFHQGPVQAFRAVTVTQNDAARAAGFFIPKNMRVPQRSVIARALVEDLANLEVNEDLSWWTASDGSRLSDWPIRVVARRAGNGTQALITPTK